MAAPRSAFAPLPTVILELNAGRPLDDLRATAARLWLAAHGDAVDPEARLREAVRSYWSSRPGDDPYWDSLAPRRHDVDATHGAPDAGLPGVASM